jgi:hypothetical protein
MEMCSSQCKLVSNKLVHIYMTCLLFVKICLNTGRLSTNITLNNTIVHQPPAECFFFVKYFTAPTVVIIIVRITSS